MTTTPPDYPRLEDQIAWFDEKSANHERWYRRLKIMSILAAALVPLVSGLEGYAFVAGFLGVTVVLVEGLQHINQHHENWIRYRATCEQLRREKFLYRSGAGPYEGLDEAGAFRLLAGRVEDVLSQEGRAWVAARQSLDRQVFEGGAPAGTMPRPDGG